MTRISIDELHEHTNLWVRKVTDRETILVTDNGQPVAQIVPVSISPRKENPFLTRKVLPEFAELQSGLRGGTDSAQIISEMRGEE
jgi:prevent-host-death family protein